MTTRWQDRPQSCRCVTSTVAPDVSREITVPRLPRALCIRDARDVHRLGRSLLSRLAHDLVPPPSTPVLDAPARSQDPGGQSRHNSASVTAAVPSASPPYSFCAPGLPRPRSTTPRPVYDLDCARNRHSRPRDSDCAPRRSTSAPSGSSATVRLPPHADPAPHPRTSAARRSADRGGGLRPQSPRARLCSAPRPPIRPSGRNFRGDR